MAVFPDRIVLKNSTDSQVAIEAAIGSGGSDQIQQGELVLGIQPGSVDLYTIDGNGDVVSLSSEQYIGELLDVDLTPAPADGQILAYNATDELWRPDTRLANVVEDATPQLGGNLETMGFWIEGNQGNDIVLAAETGQTVFRGAAGFDASIRLNCSANSHGVTLQSPPHAAGASYTLTLPVDTGVNGQALTTDGSGVLSWADNTAGGVTSIIAGSGVNISPANGIGDVTINALGAEGGSAGRGDGGDFDLGAVGSAFVLGVYGAGDFDSGVTGLPEELLVDSFGPDAGNFD